MRRAGRWAGGASTPVASRWTSVPPPCWFSLPRHFQCYAGFCYLSMNVMNGVAHRWGRRRRGAGGGGQAVAAIFVWVSLFYPPPAWTLLSSSATIRSNHLPVSFCLKTDALCEQMSASRFTSSSSYCPALCCCFFLPLFSIFNIPNFIIFPFSLFCY